MIILILFPCLQAWKLDPKICRPTWNFQNSAETLFLNVLKTEFDHQDETLYWINTCKQALTITQLAISMTFLNIR